MIHFMAGMPRSGSTLLAAILAQNPRFHASMSGPMGTLVGAVLSELSDANEFSPFISNEQRGRILAGLFVSYYGDRIEDVVFDTGRIWCARLELLKALFPQSKIIACVRNPPWIVDSIEQLIRRNVFQPSAIFDKVTRATVYSRAEALSAGDGIVGFAFNATKQAFYSDDPSNLMLLRFETLTADPARAMAAVYDFIGEPGFEHDFDNVRFDAAAAAEFDRSIGTPGLHTVRPKVRPVSRASVLPPDLFARLENDAFWLDPAANPRRVRVV